MTKLALLATLGFLAFAGSSSATDTLNLQNAMSPFHGQVRLYWAGDYSTTTVLPFYQAPSGQWVGGYYLANSGPQQNNGVIYGQPSGARVYKVCEDKAQTVCSNARTVTVR